MRRLFVGTIAFILIAFSAVLLWVTNPNDDNFKNWVNTNLLEYGQAPLTTIVFSACEQHYFVKHIGTVDDYKLFSIHEFIGLNQERYRFLGIFNRFYPMDKDVLFSQSEDYLWEDSNFEQTLDDNAIKEESHYFDKSGENPNLSVHIFDGGDLRVIKTMDNKSVVAVLLNKNNIKYANITTTQDNDKYYLSEFSHFLGIAQVNTIDQELFEAIKNEATNLSALEKLLGNPTYSIHVHGLGSVIYVFARQGLSFVSTSSENILMLFPSNYKEFPTDSLSENRLQNHNSKLRYDDYLTMKNENISYLIESSIKDLIKVEEALIHGKMSPGGQFTATILTGMGYWDNWIVISRENMGELRYQADYFIDGIEWVDEYNLLYGTGMEELYRINVFDDKQSHIVNLTAEYYEEEDV